MKEYNVYFRLFLFHQVLWRQFLKFKETELPAKEADKNRSKNIYKSFEASFFTPPTKLHLNRNICCTVQPQSPRGLMKIVKMCLLAMQKVAES